jgi:hypothetical protein
MTGVTAVYGSVALIDDGLGQGRPMRRRQVQVPPPRSGFAGFRFPPEVILVAVRWYLRYGLCNWSGLRRGLLISVLDR